MRRILIVLVLLALSLGLASALTVTGTVVSADGKPIKGANVLLYLSLFGDRTTHDLLTDAQGGYSVEVEIDPALLQQDEPLGMIVAYAPGYALARAQFKKSGNVITLNPGTSISGVVTDAGGKPLAGVSVALHSCRDRDNNYAFVFEEWRARFTVTSAPDGSWTLPGIPQTGTALVYLDDDRYVHEQQQVTLAAGEKTNPVRFTARPGATVTGRVLTPPGAPAADAYIYAYPQQNTLRASTGSSKTAADGSYRITGLATGSYAISADSEKQAWIAEPLKDITLTEGKETAAPDLHAHSGAVLEDTVVDAETGTPIPGVQIAILRGKNEQAAGRLSTDNNGHFLYRTEPEQMALLSMQPQRGYLRMLDTEAVPVDLQEGKTVTVVLKLHKGLSVTGTVSDGEGKPVVGAGFSLWLPYSKNGERSQNDTNVSFITDQQGHFELTGLPAGLGTLTLNQANNNKFAEWEQRTPQTIQLPAKEPIAVKVTRLVMQTVTGRVVDTQQRPQAGVTVDISVSNEAGNQQHLTAVTGEDGGYQLAKIPIGYQVSLFSLEKAGYRQFIDHTLSKAGKDTIIDAVLGDALLDGTVLDAETGTPIPGAQIMILRGKNDQADWLNTDRNGNFFYRTQSAQVMVVVSNPPDGYLKMADTEAVKVNLQAGKTVAAVLKLRKGLSVTGTVIDGQDKPVSGLGVSC